MNTITNHHVKNINGGTRQNVILHAEDLKKYYGSGETEVRALDGINLDIYQGDFVAVVGTSGSGKSTLLNMLGGLDTPTEIGRAHV